MEPKYVEAIKAGVIGGVILAALQLVSELMSLLNVVNVDDYTNGVAPTITGAMTLAVVFGCGICILYIVVLAGTGAMAVRMTRELLRDLNDAVVTSAFAGAVAGLIWGIVSVILGILTPIIKPEYTSSASKLGGSLLSGVCGVICCLPAEIVIGAVIALIGGAIYYTLVAKK